MRTFPENATMSYLISERGKRNNQAIQNHRKITVSLDEQTNLAARPKMDRAFVFGSIIIK